MFGRYWFRHWFGLYWIAAIGLLNTFTILLSQVALFAETSNDALLGTETAGTRIFACWWTSGPARMEFFIQTTLIIDWNGCDDAKSEDADKKRKSELGIHRGLIQLNLFE